MMTGLMANLDCSYTYGGLLQGTKVYLLQPKHNSFHQIKVTTGEGVTYVSICKLRNIRPCAHIAKISGHMNTYQYPSVQLAYKAANELRRKNGEPELTR